MEIAATSSLAHRFSGPWLDLTALGTPLETDQRINYLLVSR
jgi:hypothetical protein